MSKEPHTSADVLIVGAGFSGIGAARVLHQAGLKTLVLEARDRIGGRVYTDEVKGSTFDYGAMMIHGNHTSLYRIARDEKIPIYKAGHLFLRPQRSLLALAKSCLRSNTRQMFSDLLRLRYVYMRNPELRTASFAQFMESASPKGDQIHDQIQKFFSLMGAPADRVETRVLMEDQSTWMNSVNWRLANFSDFALHLATPFRENIHLNTVCRSIRWKRGHVTIECESRGSHTQYEAEQVVCTLPLGVLKARGVLFDPDLPDWKYASMEALGLADFAFLRAYWNGSKPDPRDFSSVDEGQLMYPALTKNYFFCRAESPLLESFRDAEPDKWPEVLTSKFETEKASLFSEIYVHDWLRDPLTRGAVSYGRPGSAGARHLLGLSLDNTILFAGEATAGKGAWGTVHGAFDTGVSSANELLANRGLQPSNQELAWH